MSVPDTADRALRDGRTLLELGRVAEALERLSAAVARDPEDGPAHCELAHGFLKAHRPLDALESADAAMRLMPWYERPHRIRAIALTQLRRETQAVEAAEEAVRLAPEFSDAHAVLASALLAAGRPRSAHQSALKARELDPEATLPYAVLGRISLKERRNEDAEQYLRDALKLDPEEPDLHNNLGVALLRQGRKTEAAEAFERAARLEPADHLPRRNLAASVRAHVNSGWLVWISWIGIYIGIRAATSNSSGALLFALIVGGGAVAIYLFGTRYRMRALSPAALRVAAQQSFFERFDLSGWVPWPLLIPSPLWLVGAIVYIVSSVTSHVSDGAGWTHGGLAGLAIAILIAGYSAGRSRVYLKRRGWWPWR